MLPQEACSFTKFVENHSTPAQSLTRWQVKSFSRYQKETVAVRVRKIPASTRAPPLALAGPRLTPECKGTETNDPQKCPYSSTHPRLAPVRTSSTCRLGHRRPLFLPHHRRRFASDLLVPSYDDRPRGMDACGNLFPGTSRRCAAESIHCLRCESLPTTCAGMAINCYTSRVRAGASLSTRQRTKWGGSV